MKRMEFRACGIAATIRPGLTSEQNFAAATLYCATAATDWFTGRISAQDWIVAAHFSQES